MEDDERKTEISLLVVDNRIFCKLLHAAADLERADDAKGKRQACKRAQLAAVELFKDIEADSRIYRPFLLLARALSDLEKGKRSAFLEPNPVVAQSGGKPVGTSDRYVRQITAAALVELLIQDAALSVTEARREVAAAYAHAGHQTAHNNPMNDRTVGDWHKNQKEMNSEKVESRLEHIRSGVKKSGSKLYTENSRRDFLQSIAIKLAESDI